MGLSFTIAPGSPSSLILRSESCGTHDHILLSQFRDSPNLKNQVPVFTSYRNRVTQLYPLSWKPKSEGFWHAYMTEDMERDPSYRWGLIKWYRDMSMINPSRSNFLIEVNERREFQPDRKGGLIWYTDGWKLSFSLEQYTTVFRAVVRGSFNK
jgi:hypothetical protein